VAAGQKLRNSLPAHQRQNDMMFQQFKVKLAKNIMFRCWKKLNYTFQLSCTLSYLPTHVKLKI